MCIARAEHPGLVTSSNGYVTPLDGSKMTSMQDVALRVINIKDGSSCSSSSNSNNSNSNSNNNSNSDGNSISNSSSSKQGTRAGPPLRAAGLSNRTKRMLLKAAATGVDLTGALGGRGSYQQQQQRMLFVNLTGALDDRVAKESAKEVSKVLSMAKQQQQQQQQPRPPVGHQPYQAGSSPRKRSMQKVGQAAVLSPTTNTPS